MLRRSSLRLVALLLLLTPGCGPGVGRTSSDPPCPPYRDILDARDLVASDADASVAAHEALLASTPRCLLAHRGLQDVRRRVSEPDAFQAAYRSKVDQSPDDPVAWYLLGRAVIDLPEQAEEAFNRAHDLDPTLAWPVAGLAYLRYSRGDIFGAVTIYEDGVRRAPDSARMRLLLGNQYLELKLYIHALRHLEIAARLAPDDLEVRAALGKARLALGEEDRALELLEGVLAEEPRLHHTYPTLAAIYLRRDRATDADRIYRSGLELGMVADDELASEIRSGLVLDRIRTEVGGP